LRPSRRLILPVELNVAPSSPDVEAVALTVGR
jgi:hypothetical protein